VFSEQAWAGLLLVVCGCVDILFGVVAMPSRSDWDGPTWVFVSVCCGLFVASGVVIVLFGLSNFFGGIT
jgi:hypothetical protein